VRKIRPTFRTVELVNHINAFLAVAEVERAMLSRWIHKLCKARETSAIGKANR
jgi:hypothetical protein